MKTRNDILLITNNLIHNSKCDDEKFPPFTDEIIIDDNLSIKKLKHQEVELIFNSCEAPGFQKNNSPNYRFEATRQFWEMITIVSLCMRIKKGIKEPEKKRKKAKDLSKRCRYTIVKKGEKSKKAYNNGQIFF